MIITVIIAGGALYGGYKLGKKNATIQKAGCIEKFKRVYNGVADVIRQEFGSNKQPAKPQVQPNVPQPQTPAPPQPPTTNTP